MDISRAGADARHQRAQLHRADEAGDPPLRATTAVDPRQYQALCLTPGGLRRHDGAVTLAHTSIHSWNWMPGY